MATSPPTLPTVRIENIGPAQSNIPFTFGQVFQLGHMPAGSGLAGVIDDKNVLQLQVDVKATHADGSVRFAVISGGLPKADAGQVIPMTLTPRGSTWKASTFAPAPMLKGPPVVATLTIEGVAYSTKLFTIAAPGGELSGPVAQEWQVVQPLIGPAGETHPHLTVRFRIRAYSNAARIEAVIENCRTFGPSARNYTYDMVLTVPGNTMAATGILHFHHALARFVIWTGTEPKLIVHPDTAYLIATRAIPNYDMSVKPDEADLALMMRNIAHPNAGAQGGVGPMKIGPVNPAMGATGGRPDIAPLPEWSVAYLLTHDLRAWQVMMAAADGSGTWPIHYRDENTGYPVRIDNAVNKEISTHMNMSNKGPLPLPRFVAGRADVPIRPDTAHQPGLTYLPYLLTGDYYYLEELQFWAAWNNLETAPGNRGFDKGLLNWHQVRGQAWSLRTLGQAAYITPDAHPLKKYLLQQMDNNLDFYHHAYVVGNPNALGIYDGSGPGSFQLAEGVAPFQDSYLTWSLGYLVELGFEKARPILQWKAKFLKGTLTDPEFDPIAGMDYWLQVRDTPTSPIYSTFGEVYRKNFGGLVIKDDNRNPRTHPKGTLFIDQPRGSKEQAAWLTEAFKYTWKQGQWFGYASYEMGYAANAQPALAVIVDLADGKEAWAVFDKRTVKPDYRKGAQFNIIPRSLSVAPPVVVTPPVVTPPVVTPPPAVPPVVTPPAPKLNARARLEIAIQAHSEVAEADRVAAASQAVTTLGEVLASERGIVQAGKK